ncbi:MAG: oxidoreductase [Pseudomonadota bacterium]
MNELAVLSEARPAPLRVALVGYGGAGKAFHAPVIASVPGLDLACIVSSRPAAVRADWPDMHVVPTPALAFEDPTIDLVVIATTNESHHPLARAALQAGKHVLVDKPCTVTLAETEDLLALARRRERVLTVYQSRRHDADFLSLREVLRTQKLGRVVHFESHFDRFRPAVLNRWRDKDIAGSGLWLDLGSHLVDQCLQLFGCPDDILLDTALQRDACEVHDYFHAQLRYDTVLPGFRALLHASSLASAGTPRFLVHGTAGSFVKYGFDSQEDALKAGQRLPAHGTVSLWGIDGSPGEIVTLDGSERRSMDVPATAGNYGQYYANLRDCLLSRRAGEAVDPDVSPRDVMQVMALLSRGEQSARERREVSTADLRGRAN